MDDKNLYAPNENGLYTTRQAMDIINNETKAAEMWRPVDSTWLYVQIRGRMVGTKITKADGETKRYKYKISGLSEGVDYKKISGRFYITAKGVARMLRVRREQLTLKKHESRRSGIYSKVR